MLELFLTSEGYSVISSEDGQVGLDVAKRERPAVIITNLNMPNLDGTEMIKQLRQEPGLDGATIIVLSAVRTENPQALINAGVSAVLSKPVELEELLRIINNALTGIACQNKS
jgi:DNA-binding response OmpR family regulator